MGKQVVCGDGTIYPEYHQYLAGPHWAGKKREFFASIRFWGCCVVCGVRKGLHVHHMNYKNIGAEKVEDLTCLCRGCHAKYHKETRRQIKRKRVSKKAKKKRSKEKTSRLYVGKIDRSSGPVKRFTPAEIEEYEMQRAHMADI